MNVTTSTAPVRHFVIDGFASPRPDWTPPPPEWPGWEAVYSNDCERGKRATRQVFDWNADVLAAMHELTVLRQAAHLFGVAAWPDALLWGGGLQVIAPGGHLNTHLDANLHPNRRYSRRAVQMVCFLHYEWKVEWGGEFYLADPAGEVVQTYAALPGRLVVFENTDLAYHGVLPTSPNATERVSVSSCLLADARPEHTRTRALFMPSRVPRYAAPPETTPA